MNFCLSSPKIWDVCSPASTAKEDLERGKWIRIDKDFNKGIGLTFNYLYVRRLQVNSNLPVVTSITLVRGKEVEMDPTIELVLFYLLFFSFKNEDTETFCHDFLAIKL